MNKSLFSSTLIVLLCLIFSSSGCKDKETLKNGTFTIAEADLSKEFGSGTETIFIPVQTIMTGKQKQMPDGFMYLPRKKRNTVHKSNYLPQPTPLANAEMR